MYGAEPVDARVVVDRNRVTGGGVTAGIDFGLVLLAKLRGDDAAKLTQLAMEYDPEPPFNAGNPKAAGPEVIEQAMSMMAAEMEQQAQVSCRAIAVYDEHRYTSLTNYRQRDSS